MRPLSKTALFFAQSKTGAQQQKSAREELKKPQALGGSAAAGTQMVAGATQAQQQATGQVQQVAQSASKDLNVDPTKFGTSMTTAVSGAPTVSAPAAEIKVKSGESGDVASVEASGKVIQDRIDTTTNTLNDLNTRLQTAEGEDRAKLQAEKERLELELKRYRDMQLNDKLGQIGESSLLGQDALDREMLLAEEGNNVGKLAALFGGKKRQYGGLEAQMYGKDLEAIQEAARSGLEEKELAEQQSDIELENLGKEIEKGKKGYEAGLSKETEKLDVLTKTPNELTNYNKLKLIELFGDEKTVNNLFNFDEKTGKVTGTKATQTRQALQDRLTQLNEEKGKVDTEIGKAKEVQELRDSAKKDADTILSAVEPGSYKLNQKQADDLLTIIKNRTERGALNRTFNAWSGISRDKGIVEDIININNQIPRLVEAYQRQMQVYYDAGKYSELKRIKDEMNTKIQEQKDRINKNWKNLSDNAKRAIGK